MNADLNSDDPLDRLFYPRQELFLDDQHGEPFEVDGRRYRGSVTADGQYHPSCSEVRTQATAAWAAAFRWNHARPVLLPRAGELLPIYPNLRQAQFLISHRAEKTLASQLRTFAKMDALAEYLPLILEPDIDHFFVEDLSEMAVGHLNSGLLLLQAQDHAGSKGECGWSQIWFEIAAALFDRPGWPIGTEELLDRLGLGTPDSLFIESAPAGLLDQRILPEVIPHDAEKLFTRLAQVVCLEATVASTMRWASSLLNAAPISSQIQDAKRLLAAMRVGRALTSNGLRVVVSEASELTWIGVDGSLHHGFELMDQIWRHVLAFESSANVSQILDRLWAGIAEELGDSVLLEEFNSVGHIKRSPEGVWTTRLMGETRLIGDSPDQ